MKYLTALVQGFSRVLDRIAGVCLFAIMFLVVLNIITRGIFNHPIAGTYDYVNLLTAAAIGLALAYCAFQDGHIAVSFVMEKLPPKMQAVIDLLINSLGLVFWALAAWFTAGYARSLTANNMVSATSGVPLSPVVYLITLGLVGLCLVLLLRIIESWKRMIS